MKTITFLGCGKNQYSAMMQADKLGYKITGVDIDEHCKGRPLCKKFIKQSILSDNLKEKVKKTDIVISFSPGIATFNEQYIKNTIGLYALNTIENNQSWMSLFRGRYPEAMPDLFSLKKKVVCKLFDNRSCGGGDKVRIIDKCVMIDYIKGKNYHYLFVILNGKVIEYGCFTHTNTWKKINKRYNIDIDKIMYILNFKSGVLMIEVIGKYIIDIGIEKEPEMIEQVISYKELFKVYE